MGRRRLKAGDNQTDQDDLFDCQVNKVSPIRQISMSQTASNQSDSFISGLFNSQAYPHPVDKIEMRETHISWVFLTGDYAYKIKKPVDFGFLDFSTLERREHFCHEELRLNGRYAPQLYLEVIPITGDVDSPRLGGEGPVLDYAVKMRQFDEAGLFTNLLRNKRLSLDIIDETAEVIAAFHQDITAAAPDSPYGTPDAIHAPVAENFQQLSSNAAELLNTPQVRETFEAVEDWSQMTYEKLQPILAQRKADGFIRECHGDLHLGNLALINGKVTPFDGIEFNPNLHWIDVISELAFLLMDLEEHDARPLAQRLRNHYLEITGDYAGLKLLSYYQAYRAMVRAKVAALRLEQADAERKSAEEEINNYLQAALGYTRSMTPTLVITHGLSGSGKTTLSQNLVDGEGYIRIRSDVERKRLFGLKAQDKTESAMDAGIYTPSASQKTYAQLAELAETIIMAGYSVVVDATFLKRAQRAVFQQLAQQHQIAFRILHCSGTEEELKARIRQRQREDRDASEADIQVLEKQLQTVEPLTVEEQPYSFHLDIPQV
jgi:aminoglycoside phosphotransferase family enzyme/predicted kinase